MTQTPHDKLEDAFGAARSYLHAIRMAAAGMQNQRDMCALDLLAEAAENEINEAQAIVESSKDIRSC